MMLIIQLRNPSIRAISEFMHHNRHGRYIKLLHDVTVPINASPEAKENSKAAGKPEKKKKENIRKESTGTSARAANATSSAKAANSIIYKKYKKGRILRNYHSYTTSDRFSTMSATKSNTLKFMDENDDFHIDVKQLKAQDYVALPYPCDVHDMMHYFLGTPNRMHVTVPNSDKSASSYLFGKGNIEKSPETPQTADQGKGESGESVAGGSSTSGNDLKKSNSTTSTDGKTSMSSEEDLQEIAATIDKQQQQSKASPIQNGADSKSKKAAAENKKDSAKVNSDKQTSQQQQQSYPKEILNGYYDLQLQHVFK
jgi:hypothetical protein